MVRHYDSEQEAYATRHELWEQRLQRERDSPGPAAPDAVHPASTPPKVRSTSPPASTPEPESPLPLSNIAHVGFVRSVAAGGQRFGLVSHDKGTDAAVAMLLRELASSELAYVNDIRAALRSAAALITPPPATR